MADNIKVKPAVDHSAMNVATDEIANVHYPVYKVSYGADGEQTPVSPTSPLPVYTIQPRDFFFEVAAGNIAGHFANNISAHNNDIDQDIKTVGAYGSGQIYVYPTTASIDYISSDNAGDTHEITIIGLDINYAKVIQTKTLTGTTPVAIDTPLLRINHFLNNSATASQGTIFLWDSPSGNGTEHTAGVPTDNGSIKAYIGITIAGETISDEHHLSTVFTVPAGKTAFIVFGKTTVSDSKAMELTFWVRKEGGVFLQTHHIDIVAVNYDYFFKLPGSVPEKSDLEVRATVAAGTAEVSAHYDIIAVDN